jgi:NTP pyrophosphatase (non-canonical NTP hydrolase)
VGEKGTNVSTETSATAMTLPDLLDAVEIVDAHLDANTAPGYLAQPLAADWARVTKVCEEAGEVWAALSKYTGENPRKGVCGTLDDLLGELGDTVSAGICAIQHLTKDTDRTWEVVSAALAKARGRVEAAVGEIRCKNCTRTIARCASLPSHGGCSSAAGWIHELGWSHDCRTGPPGSYAYPNAAALAALSAKETCAGSCYQADVQADLVTGTHVITVRGVRRRVV